MFNSAAEEARFLDAIVAALPPKNKARMATGIRRLKGHTGPLVDSLLSEAPFELPGFNAKQIAILRSAGVNVLNSMTTSTPVEEPSVSTGWQGDPALFIDALRAIPEGLGASFADALARHENPGEQAFVLATGCTLPDVTPCPTLKGALPKGKSRDAVLACLRVVLAGGVADYQVVCYCDYYETQKRRRARGESGQSGLWWQRSGQRGRL